MLAKSVLVMWLMVGRGETQIQYVVRMPTEAACQAEAAKVEAKKTKWQMYPVQHASCVMDVSAPSTK